MYVCVKSYMFLSLFCFFSISFSSSVVHYARDCSCTCVHIHVNVHT